MDEEGAMLGVGFAIDFHDSFGQLRSLDDLIGVTQANAVREFQRLEAASKGVLNLAGATAQLTAFGNSVSREMQSAARDTAKAENAGEALVRQLERQNTAFGLSRAELRANKVEMAAVAAERTGLSELAERLINSEIALQAKEAAAAEQAAQARIAAAERAADAEIASLRAVNSQLAVREQLEAAIRANTGLGREKATDPGMGATYSALTAKFLEDEKRDKDAAALATKRLADEQQRLAGIVQASHAAQMADAAAAERLRETTDPLYAATKRLNAEIAESTRLYHLGATAPAEYARQQQVLTGRLNEVGRAHDAVVKAGSRNSGMLTQLSFQLNDVATMAALGAPPMQIFASQAGQIFQIAQMAEGGMKGFAASIGQATKAALLFTVTNPILLTLAAVAGTAYVALTKFQGQVKDSGELTRYRDSLGLTHKEMLQLSDGVDKAGGKIKALGDVTVTTGDVMSGLWKALSDNADFSGPWDSLKSSASDAFDSVLKGWLTVSSGITAVIYGTFDAVKIVWGSFPAVFGDLFVQGVNAAITALNGLVKAGVDQLNGFIASANKLSFVHLGNVSAPQIDPLANANAGAAAKSAKELGDVYTNAYARARKADDAFWAQVGHNAKQSAKDRMAEQAAAIKADRTPRKPKVDHHAEQLARENEAIEAQIRNLYALADAYGVSGAAALIAEARVKAESDAIKKRGDIEVFVNRQVRLAIAERVKDAAKATAALKDQADAQARANLMVAAGMSVYDVDNQVKDDIADQQLLAAIQAANQQHLAKEAQAAADMLEKQRAARQKLRAEEEQTRFDKDAVGGANQLALLQAEIGLIGASDAARIHELATIRATQEALEKYQDVAHQQAYVKQQVAISDATQKLADDTRAYNDALTFTADKWDIIAGKVQAAGQGMADAFGTAGRAIGDMASIYANYQASRTRAEQEHEAAIKRANGDEKQLAQERTLFALRSSGAQIQAFGDMTDAAKGFFKEHSAGYKAMEAAEKVFRAIQLAMSLQSMIQSALETTTRVTGAAAQATAEGTAGIAAQSKLPFPLNIAAMAATAAALVAAGISVIGSLGGGKNTLPKANDGTGTVLGDATAKSESIKRSIDALKEVDTVMLTYSRQMASSLQSIDSQIGGFASLVLRTGDVNASGSVTEGFKANAIGSALGAIPLVGGILKSLFGISTKVVGSGLFGDAQSLGDILGSGFDASYYSDVQKKKKLFGITTSTKYSTKYSDADSGLENQFTLILRQFDQAIMAAAGPLGVSTDEITQKLNGFVVDIGKIDLQGLTGDEIEEKLSAVFGAAADDMAKAAFPGIEKFQKVGEGLFETLVRVSSTVESVRASLGLLGSAGVSMSTDVKMALAGQFDSVSDFTSAASTYFETYYSKQEQVTARTAQMAQVFASLGATMPSSIAAFRLLVEAQDLTTAAGQSTYATLLQLAPAFADLQSAMSGAKSAADILSEQQDLQRQLLELQGDTAAIRALDLAAIDPSNRALQQQVWALQDAKDAAAAADQLRQAWSSVGDGIMAEVNRIRGLTDGSATGSFALLQGQFNAATAAARGGDQDAAGKLVGLSQSLLTVAGNTATSRQELDRVKAQVAASLEGTAGLIAAITGANTGTSSASALASAATTTQANSPAAANDDLLTELHALRDEVAQLRSDNNAGHAGTAAQAGRSARVLEDVSAAAGGQAISIAGEAA
jgi:hypothetical protein